MVRVPIIGQREYRYDLLLVLYADGPFEGRFYTVGEERHPGSRHFGGRDSRHYPGGLFVAGQLDVWLEDDETARWKQEYSQPRIIAKGWLLTQVTRPMTAHQRIKVTRSALRGSVMSSQELLRMAVEHALGRLRAGVGCLPPGQLALPPHRGSDARHGVDAG